MNCLLPTELCGTSVDAVEQGECLLVTVRLLTLLVHCLVKPALVQKQTRRRNFHLRRELRLR